MGGSSQQDDFVSEINVTPFVDVMLVLLIIFMITAPMMTEGLDVDLPKVETSEVLPTENDHVILTIKADTTLFLDEYETTLLDLPSVLKVNVEEMNRQLFVRADENVPYGVVMKVMGAIRGSGIEDVGLVTVSAGAVQDSQSSQENQENSSSQSTLPNTTIKISETRQ